MHLQVIAEGTPPAVYGARERARVLACGIHIAGDLVSAAIRILIAFIIAAAISLIAFISAAAISLILAILPAIAIFAVAVTALVLAAPSVAAGRTVASALHRHNLRHGRRHLSSGGSPAALRLRLRAARSSLHGGLHVATAVLFRSSSRRSSLSHRSSRCRSRTDSGRRCRFGCAIPPRRQICIAVLRRGRNLRSHGPIHFAPLCLLFLPLAALLLPGAGGGSVKLHVTPQSQHDPVCHRATQHAA